MAVIGVEQHKVTSYENRRSFGAAGPYERLDLTIEYAVDPGLEANRAIVDLAAADRSDDGLVHFSGDAVVLRPTNPDRANRFGLLDVPNRGHRRSTHLFNRAESGVAPIYDIPPGDGFLMNQGFTLAWVGWQWDVPRSPARMGLSAPQVSAGEPGWMQLRLQLPADTPSVLLTDQHVGPLGGHEPIEPADPTDPEAVLYVRDELGDEPALMDRSSWRFTGDAKIELDGGLRAGRIYDLVYRVGNRPVVGAGLLAARDLAAFLRSDRADNPAASWIDRLVITGISQNSRFIRHLLSLGLDVDEDGRSAIDGVIAVVGGARRGEFNHRYGQPSVQPTPSFGHLFPFADLPQTDQRSGIRAGLLDHVATRTEPPKIMFTDTSAEYWRGDASLSHTSVVDGSDVDEAPFVRRYLFSGTQHGAGAATLETRTIQGSRGANPLNIIDYRPLYRCALMNLVAWIKSGIDPPPSAVPRIDDATAATRTDALAALATIPSLALPGPDSLPVIRALDLGPDADRGIGRYPARAFGEPYPSVVSAVDLDGNEIAGVQMPDVTVAVATHTGFNPRHPETGAEGQILEYYGSSVPFSRTTEQRVAAGDPRPSIEERYVGVEDYLDRVRLAAEELVEQRRLLAGDVELCVEIARERWMVVVESEA